MTLQYRLLVRMVIIVILSTICFGCGVCVGIFYTLTKSYHEKYLHELELITPIVTEDEHYVNIKLTYNSSGGVYAHGTVKSYIVRDQLRESILRKVGESRAEEIVVGVYVE